MNERRLRVICLCAGWCGVCTEYRAVFDEAASSFGTDAGFSWIDIEDGAALVDDIEVENFPTLLIASDGDPVFFGPITPQPATIARLVQGAIDGDLEMRSDAAPLRAFLLRLRESPPASLGT